MRRPEDTASISHFVNRVHQIQAYSPSVVIFVINDAPCSAQEFLETPQHRKLNFSYRNLCHGRWMVPSWTRVISLGVSWCSQIHRPSMNQQFTKYSHRIKVNKCLSDFGWKQDGLNDFI